MGVGRQHCAQRNHRFRFRRRTAVDAQAELEQRIAGHCAARYQFQRDADLAHVEHFKLGFHAPFHGVSRHDFQIGGAVDRQEVAEIHAAAIERAQLRAQPVHMFHALIGSGHVGAVDHDRRIFRIQAELSAHAAGEVENDIDIRSADAFHHLVVIFKFPAARAGLRIANMDVHDCGAGAGCLQAGGGDLGGRHRNMGAASG